MKDDAIVGWKPFSDDPRVASGRLRCRAPLAVLRRAGFPVEIYRPENEGQYRAVVLQKRFDAEHQTLARRLQRRGVRVALDLCDNYLYTQEDPSLVARAEDVRRMLDLVDRVTVSTQALARHMPRAATVIRDGVEGCAPWRLVRPRGGRNRLDLIWFGVWGHPILPFGMRDIATVCSTLADIAGRTPTRLTVVSNSRAAYERWVEPLPLPTRYVEWTGHGHLCGLLRRHDACVIPIRPDPYSECKSPNRLALALSLGVPVIATSIPSYREFGEFCALDRWESGLGAVAHGRAALRERTEQGRDYVRGQHLVVHAAAEWKSFLECLLN